MYPLTPVTAITFSRNHEGTAQAIMNFEGRKYDYTPRNAYEERYQMQPPEILERMRPWDSGMRYLNFTESTVDPRSIYGRGTDRLREIRARVDPGALFLPNHPV